MKVTKIAQLLGHNGALYTLEQGNAPHLFYAGGSEGLVVEWNLEKQDADRVVAKVPGVVYAIKKLGPRFLAIGTDKGGIHIIDLDLKKEIKYLVNHTQGIFDIAYLPAQSRFIAASGDGAFSVWNSADYTCLAAVKLCDAKLRCVDVNHSETLFAIACGDNTVRVFNAETLAFVHSINDHSQSANVVKFHPDGVHLLTGSKDAHLNIYDSTLNYTQVKSIPAHNFALYGIAFSPDGSLFATASRDKTTKIWNADTFELQVRISLDAHEGHKNSVNKVLWTSYNNYLVTTGDDRAIFAWQIV